jgi:hypothetical protein
MQQVRLTTLGVCLRKPNGPDMLDCTPSAGRGFISGLQSDARCGSATAVASSCGVIGRQLPHSSASAECSFSSSSVGSYGRVRTLLHDGICPRRVFGAQYWVDCAHLVSNEGIHRSASLGLRPSSFLAFDITVLSNGWPWMLLLPMKEPGKWGGGLTLYWVSRHS